MRSQSADLKKSCGKSVNFLFPRFRGIFLSLLVALFGMASFQAFATAVNIDRRDFLRGLGALAGASRLNVGPLAVGQAMTLTPNEILSRANDIVGSNTHIYNYLSEFLGKGFPKRPKYSEGPEYQSLMEIYANDLGRWQTHDLGLHPPGATQKEIDEISRREQVKFAVRIAELEPRLAARLGLPLEQVREEVIDVLLQNWGRWVTTNGAQHRFVRRFEPLEKAFIEPFLEELGKFYPQYASSIRHGLPFAQYGQFFRGYIRGEWYERSGPPIESSHKERRKSSLPESEAGSEAEAKSVAEREEISTARLRIIAALRNRGSCDTALTHSNPVDSGVDGAP